MIEPNSSWIFQWESAWQPHSFNYLTVNAATRQPEPMPACVNPHHASPYVGPNGYSVCGLPADKCVKIEDEGRFEQHCSFPNIRTSLPTMNSRSNENQLHLPSGHDWKETPCETSYSQQKKFLVFDRSGEETRMILSTLCSPIWNGAAVTAEPVLTYKSLEKLHAFESELSCPKEPDLSDNAGENRLTGEGSDYREDTEEINALLYSSDDDIGDDTHDHEDEDEKSTGRSPNSMDDDYKNMEEGEDFDEVTSLWHSSKRKKLLEGGSHSKLSSMETKAMTISATRLHEDESVVNLNSSNGEQAFPSLSRKRTRMHKIHDTLRILQKFIPGSNSKDPSVIIDEAISYLKSLKAKSLHMEKADGSSWCTPFL